MVKRLAKPLVKPESLLVCLFLKLTTFVEFEAIHLFHLAFRLFFV